LAHLDDILEVIGLIYACMKDVSEDFSEKILKNRMLFFRRVQIIDETVKKISNKTRKVCNDVSWREIVGMRDIVVHDYGGVTHL
jgi:uncharacterized protein with HEPN domain